MSQVTNPTISVRDHVRAHRIVVLSALLALLATAAVVLVLTIGDESSIRTSSAAEQAQPALRSDGGPDESAVAASVGSRPSAIPHEGRIASAIAGGTTRATGGPDESRVASSLSQPRSAGPDESKTAASISGR
jgi:hypothetical protein